MDWINIKKQKAPEHTFVLTYNKHSGIEVSRDSNYSFKNVTHWMPLPEKPCDGKNVVDTESKCNKHGVIKSICCENCGKELKPIYMCIDCIGDGLRKKQTVL